MLKFLGYKYYYFKVHIKEEGFYIGYVFISTVLTFNGNFWHLEKVKIASFLSVSKSVCSM